MVLEYTERECQLTLLLPTAHTVGPGESAGSVTVLTWGRSGWSGKPVPPSLRKSWLAPVFCMDTQTCSSALGFDEAVLCGVVSG